MSEMAGGVEAEDASEAVQDQSILSDGQGMTDADIDDTASDSSASLCLDDQFLSAEETLVDQSAAATSPAQQAPQPAALTPSTNAVTEQGGDLADGSTVSADAVNVSLDSEIAEDKAPSAHANETPSPVTPIRRCTTPADWSPRTSLRRLQEAAILMTPPAGMDWQRPGGLRRLAIWQSVQQRIQADREFLQSRLKQQRHSHGQSDRSTVTSQQEPIAPSAAHNDKAYKNTRGNKLQTKRGLKSASRPSDHTTNGSSSTSAQSSRTRLRRRNASCNSPPSTITTTRQTHVYHDVDEAEAERTLSTVAAAETAARSKRRISLGGPESADQEEGTSALDRMEMALGVREPRLSPVGAVAGKVTAEQRAKLEGRRVSWYKRPSKASPRKARADEEDIALPSSRIPKPRPALIRAAKPRQAAHRAKKANGTGTGGGTGTGKSKTGLRVNKQNSAKGTVKASSKGASKPLSSRPALGPKRAAGRPRGAVAVAKQLKSPTGRTILSSSGGNGGSVRPGPSSKGSGVVRHFTFEDEPMTATGSGQTTMSL